jgi:hypothetical protein
LRVTAAAVASAARGPVNKNQVVEHNFIAEQAASLP